MVFSSLVVSRTIVHCMNLVSTNKHDITHFLERIKLYFPTKIKIKKERILQYNCRQDFFKKSLPYPKTPTHPTISL